MYRYIHVCMYSHDYSLSSLCVCVCSPDSWLPIMGGAGKLIRSRDERNNLELECLLSLQQWSGAVALLDKMLKQNPDQWSHIEVYISCQIQRYKLSAAQEADRGRENTADEGATPASQLASKTGQTAQTGQASDGDVEPARRRGREEVWEGEGEGEREEDEEGKKNKRIATEDVGRGENCSANLKA